MARKKAKKSTGRKKATRVKKTVRKVKAKKAAKKTVKKSCKLKLSSRDRALTRSQQIAHLAECATLPKKDVAALFDHLLCMIGAHLKGPGEISLGGLMKVVVKRKPATKARKGINPFTGEPAIFKAKPARNIIKIRPLKKLKDLV